jgi:uncharacterized membrane protein YccC
MLWCQAGITLAHSDLNTRLMAYRGQAIKENPNEYLQREWQKQLVTLLTEVVEAISQHAPDGAATLPQGLTDTLENIRTDGAAPQTHLKQLSDITTAVQTLLKQLEPHAPVVPAPH